MLSVAGDSLMGVSQWIIGNKCTQQGESKLQKLKDYEMMNVRAILAAESPVSAMAHNIPNCKTSRACDMQSISHVMH